MLLNAKYGFYKGCDQYLFKLLLGPLQNFLLNDASGPALIKLFSLETYAKKCRRNNVFAMLSLLFFLETPKKFLEQDLSFSFFLEN